MHPALLANNHCLPFLAADPAAVEAVMLGTTQFVNAAVQLDGLAKVAVVRLCGPSTHALPCFCDMPPGLRQAVGGCYFLAAGGLEHDGSEIVPLNESELQAITRQILEAGIRCVVVCGVFSPVAAAQEQRAAAIIQQAAAQASLRPAATAAAAAGTEGEDQRLQQQQQLYVCQSHEVGQLGLLERENAAILNAALLPLAQCVVPACVQALAEAGIRAPLLFTANDGTLLSAQQALKVGAAERLAYKHAHSTCVPPGLVQ
jgi:N-methylhydantoinase A/oxoprolinase/acetone carboxylase beta subunit